MIAEKTSTTLFINHKNLNDRITETERNMPRLEQCLRCECIKIAGIPSSITNHLLEEHVILIFQKLGVVNEDNGHSSLPLIRKNQQGYC